MARNNYGFQKRSRELAKKKKKEEKRLRKQGKAEPEAVEGPAEGAVGVEGQAPADETAEVTEPQEPAAGPDDDASVASDR